MNLKEKLQKVLDEQISLQMLRVEGVDLKNSEIVKHTACVQTNVKRKNELLAEIELDEIYIQKLEKIIERL